MVQDYFINLIGNKWNNAKLNIYSNTIQIITLAYVCFLIYFAMCLYFKRDNMEKQYSKAFMFTSMYIVSRLFGSIVLGV